MYIRKALMVNQSLVERLYPKANTFVFLGGFGMTVYFYNN